MKMCQVTSISYAPFCYSLIIVTWNQSENISFGRIKKKNQIQNDNKKEKSTKNAFDW